MRTSFRSWAMIGATLGLLGCPSPRPMTDSGGPDAGRPDGGSGIDGGPGVDSGRGDGGGGGMCGFGGGCDLRLQNCMPGEGCYPVTGRTMCAGAGAAMAGDVCTNANDCEAGTLCVGPFDTMMRGHCQPVCCSADDCDPGATCNPLGDGMGGTLPNGIGVCRRPTACTPIPNAGCMAGEQCVMTGPDGSTDCVTTGTATDGMPCGSGCAPGLGCYVPMGGMATCQRICRLGMMSDCTVMGTTCRASGLGTMFGLCG